MQFKKVIQFSQTQQAETSLYQNPTGTTLTAIQQQQAPSQKNLFVGCSVVALFVMNFYML